MASPLYEHIYEIVRGIPYGTTLSYGEVAQRAGMWRGARIVGWALSQLSADNDVPWQRVVAKGGRISIQNPEHLPEEQVGLLEAEGIRFRKSEREFTIL